MKTRTFNRRDVAVPVDHPEGGKFYLFPTDIDQLQAWSAQQQDIKEGADETKASAQQRKQFLEFIDFCASRVEKLEGIVDGSGAPLDCPPEIVRAILGEFYTVEETDVEGKKTVKEDMIAQWVLDESGKLANLKKLAAVKNS